MTRFAVPTKQGRSKPRECRFWLWNVVYSITCIHEGLQYPQASPPDGPHNGNAVHQSHLHGIRPFARL